MRGLIFTKRIREYGIKLLGRIDLLTLVVLEIVLIGVILRPYVLYNNLHAYDAIGHIAAIKHLKEHLFPDFSGWNPYFYLGFPQGMFYHPMFHYLVTILSFGVGIKPAFKLVVSFSAILTLIVAYLLARSYGLEIIPRAMWLLWVWLIMRFSPSNWGGNIGGTIDLGLVANMLAIPFFFSYIATIPRLFSKRKYVVPTLLLALTTLAHVYAGLAAGICFLGFMANYVRSKKDLLLSGAHISVAILLTAFWTIPFILNRRYLSGSILVKKSSPVLTLGLFAFSLYLLFLRDSSKRYINPMVPAIFTLLTFIHLRYIPNFPFHVHRFQIYALYLAFFLFWAFVRVRSRSIALRNTDMVIVLIIASVASCLNLSTAKGQFRPRNPFILSVHGPRDFNIKVPKLNGRLLCTSVGYGNLWCQPRALSHLIAMNTGNDVCMGLFMESALNSSFLASLSLLVDPREPPWAPYSVPSNPRNILTYFQLFNINYILSPGKLSEKSPLKISPIKVEQEGISPSSRPLPPFRPLEVPRSQLIEVLNYRPRRISKNWRDEVRRWWVSEEIDKVLVYSEDPLPENVGAGGEKVEILEKSKKGDYIKFFVGSEEDVPILVKISYFPSWHAYVSGKSVPVYIASPYLMLLYGHGNIEIKYEELPYQRWSKLLSLVVLVGLIMSGTIISHPHS
ncbi:hypothetical protein J7M22_03015 [Candidatus Poribacteria bacterium]|nr:hypothetical protein [Candidatus Poribacteria bacterium]